MTTIAFRVSDKEKTFIREMAKFNNISISEPSCKQIIEGLENQIDLQFLQRNHWTSCKKHIHRRFYTVFPHQKVITDTAEFKYYHRIKMKLGCSPIQYRGEWMNA
ncbi:hypothetical protein HCB45_13090 [Listeria sp. FSL L7-0091]|uniref:type II toxin-antitoxin system RelB family antitoxin n=1 Tax=Listeria farberi TaxID=2713500 RepID=UPI001623A0AA|nr:hypothetical protein [Listeria farberi]